MHYKQKYDRDEMHKGVLRDIERLQVKSGARSEAAAAAAADVSTRKSGGADK